MTHMALITGGSFAVCFLATTAVGLAVFFWVSRRPINTAERAVKIILEGLQDGSVVLREEDKGPR